MKQYSLIDCVENFLLSDYFPLLATTLQNMSKEGWELVTIIKESETVYKTVWQRDIQQSFSSTTTTANTDNQDSFQNPLDAQISN